MARFIIELPDITARLIIDESIETLNDAALKSTRRRKGTAAERMEHAVNLTGMAVALSRAEEQD